LITEAVRIPKKLMKHLKTNISVNVVNNQFIDKKPLWGLFI